MYRIDDLQKLSHVNDRLPAEDIILFAQLKQATDGEWKMSKIQKKMQQFKKVGNIGDRMNVVAQKGKRLN